MRAKRNPIGLSVNSDTSQRTRKSRNLGFGGRPSGTAPEREVQLVRVGPKGQFTHIFDPQLLIKAGEEVVAQGAPLCGSGYRSPNGTTGQRNVPELYASDAEFATCMRCQKLASMNQRRYGQLLRKYDD